MGYLLFPLLFIWHLYSLNISPLPWYDETYFASITHSIINGQGFQLSVAPLMPSNQLFAYGPVYFLLTSLSTGLFGFGIFSFRIVNLIFAIGVIWVFFSIIRSFINNRFIAFSLLFLVSFDTILLQNAHSGRMDMVALFFVLLGFFLFIVKPNGRFSFIAGTIALALALLTTARVFFIVIPLGIYIWINYLKVKDWSKVVFLVLIPILMGFVWILYSFGTVVGAIEYFIGTSNGTESLGSSYLGGNFYIPAYQWPMIVITLVIVLLNIRKVKNDIISILFLTFISLFYLLICDTGIYSALIIVFYYLLLARNIDDVLEKRRILVISCYLLLIIVNIGIFSFKTMQIVFSKDVRNPKLAEGVFDVFVEKGSNIVGDDRYYYASIRNGCMFQYSDRGSTLESRVKYHKDVFDVDYLVFSNQTAKSIRDAYLSEFSIVDSMKIELPQDSRSPSILSHLMPSFISSSYEGTIYRVK